MNRPSSLERDPATHAAHDQECERIARPIGSAFRYACLHLDEPQRRAITAIRALDQTLDDIRRQVAEPHVARAKLDWWSNALYCLSQGEAGRADTPITRALTAALNELNVPVRELVPALESRLGGAALELDYQGFERTADMAAYLDAAGGATFELYAHLLDIPADERALWRRLGTSHLRLTRLQYLGRDIRSGFIYLPQDLMSTHNLSEADLFRPNAGETARPLLHDELDRLIEDRNTAILALTTSNRHPHRFLRALMAIDHARLRQLSRHGVSVLEQRPELSPFRCLVVAWWAGKRPVKPLSRTSVALKPKRD